MKITPPHPCLVSFLHGRFTFFRKLRLHDLLAIAYEKTSASSGGNAGHAGNTGHVGSEKIPTGGVAGGGGHQQGPELDIKSWHKFVVRSPLKNPHINS